MANVAHSSLTGADLHEPKGVASASANTVYIADGLGSGAWSPGSVLLGITGMIADFALPVAPSGWLECDGSAVSRATYATLFSAVTVQQSGTRTSGLATITGLGSTTNLKPGYSVSGTGIPVSTTILSVDSGSQITLSANAISSGTSLVIASPFALGDGSTTFNIPNAARKYRRARDTSVSVNVGAAQSDQLKSHNHSVNLTSAAGTAHTHGTGTFATVSAGAHSHGGLTGNENQGHTHSGTTAGSNSSLDHTHSYTAPSGTTILQGGGGSAVLTTTGSNTGTSSLGAMDHSHNFSTGGELQAHNHSIGSDGAHTHTFSGTLATESAHTHAVTGNTDVTTAGSIDETRPTTLVVMTCIKT